MPHLLIRPGVEGDVAINTKHLEGARKMRGDCQTMENFDPAGKVQGLFVNWEGGTKESG